MRYRVVERATGRTRLIFVSSGKTLRAVAREASPLVGDYVCACTWCDSEFRVEPLA